MSSMLRSCYDHFGKLDKTDLAAYKTCDGRSVGNIIFRYCPTFSRSGLSLSRSGSDRLYLVQCAGWEAHTGSEVTKCTSELHHRCCTWGLTVDVATAAFLILLSFLILVLFSAARDKTVHRKKKPAARLGAVRSFRFLRSLS